MNYKEYCESIKDIEISDSLEFCQAIMWLNPQRLPLGLVSIADKSLSIIKVPEKTKNRYDRIVPIITIAKGAFAGNKNITDIILPSSIQRLPQGAFAGCSSLKNITIPKSIRHIKEKTFDGCSSLENIYYEGTWEEWKAIEIVHAKHEIEFGDLIPGTPVNSVISEQELFIPGNEALLTANIYFHCNLTENDSSTSHGKMGGKDITRSFYPGL
jgi:hypothetical protein